MSTSRHRLEDDLARATREGRLRPPTDATLTVEARAERDDDTAAELVVGEGARADELRRVADVARRLRPQRRGRGPAPAGSVYLSKAEAADYLSMSVRHFERHVQPSIKARKSGRRLVFARSELAHWFDRGAARP